MLEVIQHQQHLAVFQEIRQLLGQGIFAMKAIGTFLTIGFIITTILYGLMQCAPALSNFIVGMLF